MPIMMQLDVAYPPPSLLVTSSSSFLSITPTTRVLSAVRFITPSMLSRDLVDFLLSKESPATFSQDLVRDAECRSLGSPDMRVLFPNGTPPTHPICSSPQAGLAEWLPSSIGMIVSADAERTIGFYALQCEKGAHGVVLAMDPRAVQLVSL